MAMSRASMPGSGTNCSMARSSTPFARRRSSSRVGGVTTTPSARMPRSAMTIIEHHSQARTLVDTDFQEEVLSPTLGVEMVHGLAHPQPGGQGAVWCREGGHHSIADRLDHGSSLRCDDLLQDAEVRSNEVEGGKVPDTLVKLGRSLQV